jgi:hypothetical protein
MHGPRQAQAENRFRPQQSSYGTTRAHHAPAKNPTRSIGESKGGKTDPMYVRTPARSPFGAHGGSGISSRRLQIRVMRASAYRRAHENGASVAAEPQPLLIRVGRTDTGSKLKGD